MTLAVETSGSNCGKRALPLALGNSSFRLPDTH